MALRLEAWLGEQRGRRAEIWLSQQMAYDIWHARQKPRPEIARVPGD
jgi:plasmid maintenance system antidote protein VapI